MMQTAEPVQQQSLEDLVRDKIETTFDGVELELFDDLHKMVVVPADKAIVTYVMRRCHGNQVHASRVLGINRNTLRKKLKHYGLN